MTVATSVGGNVVTASDKSFTVELVYANDPSATATSTASLSGSLYSTTLQVTHAGNATLSLLYQGSYLNGFPSNLFVLPGSLSAPVSVLRPLPAQITAGSSLNVVLEGRDQYSNLVRARAPVQCISHRCHERSCLLLSCRCTLRWHEGERHTQLAHASECAVLKSQNTSCIFGASSPGQVIYIYNIYIMTLINDYIPAPAANTLCALQVLRDANAPAPAAAIALTVTQTAAPQGSIFSTNINLPASAVSTTSIALTTAQAVTVKLTINGVDVSGSASALTVLPAAVSALNSQLYLTGGAAIVAGSNLQVGARARDAYQNYLTAGGNLFQCASVFARDRARFTVAFMFSGFYVQPRGG